MIKKIKEAIKKVVAKIKEKIEKIKLKDVVLGAACTTVAVTTGVMVAGEFGKGPWAETVARDNAFWDSIPEESWDILNC